ncbi:protein translocase subunit SecD [Neisseria sp. Ec49-e6-T10]|uniref:protein translocase subunit SecD n=1 Tax=Neisseria sp. Ec49-e6-T10 TaxID=3140744 RepID=UPI003EBC86D7
MNRYPLWKYILIVAVLIIAAIYTAPNFFGETPAVQVSTNRQAIKINEDTLTKVSDALSQAKINNEGIFLDSGSLKVRFKNTDSQLKAKDVIEKTLGDNYIIALSLMSDSPVWMNKIKAKPMFLGLDLRGGVHFLMEVDMKAANDKLIERYSGDIRRALKDINITADKIERNQNTLVISLADPQTQNDVMKALKKNLPALTLIPRGDGSIEATIEDSIVQQVQSNAVTQNIATLNNRVNGLGVAEPIIQQSGANRIVLQLPGVQNPGQVKDIIGRTATLEVHMVASDPSLLNQAIAGNVPDGYIVLSEKDSSGQEYPILLNKQVELTGDNINDAAASFDGQNNQPGVSVRFDSVGTKIFADLTREYQGQRMAMVLVEQGKMEIITAPTIKAIIDNGSTFISGSMNIEEANDIALLLRSGSLAAPMKIIEERTIGPSLGQEQISKGFHSVLWGFVAVGAFMVLYYRLFGVFSALAMTCNLLLLIAILSMMQATLTLPGIAAIALTLGVSIDSNVLINERIREELRAGDTPQQAISLGYQHAWATIVDSNVTSFIAGLALLIFGSGPVRGFAIVHCLGILTSMFSSVVVSRAFVNLWYGRRRHLQSISIGQIWRPDNQITSTSVTKE